MRGVVGAGSRRRFSLLAWRWIAASCGMVVAVSLAPLAFAEPAGARPSCPATAADGASALQTANACGARVEDLSRRSSTDQVFANPNGSMTSESTAVPRFIRNGSSWVPADATLVANGDGSVSPKAAALAVRLSNGGSEVALFSAQRKGKTLSVRWPGVLPKPTLQGSKALYAEVLPGIDLQVAVGVDSVGEVFIVKSREAAANPELARLGFALSAPGLNVGQDKLGGLSVTDAAGVVFAGGVPKMWDSSKAVASDPGALGASDASGPADGARVADMPLSVDGSSLAVSPALSMLSDPATKFPVFIDPSIDAASWTMINKKFPNQSYWSYDRHDCPTAFPNLNCAKVGYSDYDTIVMYRSLFQFPTASYLGTHVTGATFSIDLLYSWECYDTTTNLFPIDDGLGSGTTWNSDSGRWGSTAVASASNNSCHSNRTYTGFSGGGLTSRIQTAASSGWGNANFGLAAAGENDHHGWKKFDAGTAKLAVTFNSYPNVPDTLTVDGQPCGTGTGKAYVSTVGGRNPVLRARVSDPDSADHLTGTFSWTTSVGYSGGSQTNIANGQYAQVAAPATDFANGGTYLFYASTSDSTDTSKGSGGPCEFLVDNDAPNAAPTVASADGRYGGSACDGHAGWCDGVGKTGSFTFAANGVSDVVAYRYGFTSPPTNTVAASTMGGSATASITPTAPGLTDLFVRSVDRVGNLGPIADFRFFVGSGTSPVGVWHLDEGAGTSAGDSGSGHHPLTLAGSAAWGAGRVSGTSAATFNGSSSEAAAPGPVVDTAQSFSVSAWARISDMSTWRGVVSQDGSRDSAFTMYYDKVVDRWALALNTADVDNPPQTFAYSSAAPRLGIWTHLVGVYDAGGKVRLYVNGKLQSEAPAPAMWKGLGAFTVVQVWDRVVTDAEAQALAAPTQVGAWDLDEGAGTKADDSASGKHPGTLSTGTSFTQAGHNSDDPGAAHFDGATAGISTGDVVVNTSQSFSVAVWVRPSDMSNDDNDIIRQKSSDYYDFSLWYSGSSHRWSFTTFDTVEESIDAPVLDTWAHVVAVHDAGSGQNLLYVNGQLQAAKPTTSSTHANTIFGIGYKWSGDIDDVRVYQGVLSESSIKTLANS
jgi:hypothetical protein